MFQMLTANVSLYLFSGFDCFGYRRDQVGIDQRFWFLYSFAVEFRHRHSQTNTKAGNFC